MTRNLDQRNARAAFRRRLGFTMLEIMTSVTLSLMLMYSVARIFSHVGGTMNETTSIMGATNALRNAKNRLTTDLENITVKPIPPRNSRTGDGYLCYIEGLGAPLDVLYASGSTEPRGFSTAHVALDSERYAAYSEAYPDKVEEWVDTTVGDTDDILSFTSRAPAGRPFRGRYIRPKYKRNEYGQIYIHSGEQDTFESEYAEIIWFVRGTTLYRRVLPILPDQQLQDSLDAFELASQDEHPLADFKFSPNQLTDLRHGYGFFRFYDVSVHLNSEGRVVANTLGDLTNRANRYGYWNPVGVGIVDASNPEYGSVSIHGGKPDAVLHYVWYWLRLPTLQECSHDFFRAGAPFGSGRDAKSDVSSLGDVDQRWDGLAGELSYTQDGSVSSPLTGPASELPIADPPTPFIDFWDNANIWNEVDPETGDLSEATRTDFVFNQDVILTNVLSFNVKAWDPNTNDYVDLGSGLGDSSTITFDDPNDLRSAGHYAQTRAPLTRFPEPCVYDTWTEQYQRDLYLHDQASYLRDQSSGAGRSSGSISDIPLDGEISPAQLKDYPPPYNVPLKSLQIELRVFDPRSKQIRNSTFIVDLTKGI